MFKLKTKKVIVLRRNKEQNNMVNWIKILYKANWENKILEWMKKLMTTYY